MRAKPQTKKKQQQQQKQKEKSKEAKEIKSQESVARNLFY